MIAFIRYRKSEHGAHVEVMHMHAARVIGAQGNLALNSSIGGLPIRSTPLCAFQRANVPT